MAAARNIDNIKYFAPIAISRLYEKQAQFFNTLNDSKCLALNMNQRRVQSEKQFEKMQKMIFAKSKDGNYTTPAPAAAQGQAKKSQSQSQSQTPPELQ